MGILSGAFPAWSSMRSFNRLSPDERSIVFYAESGADWPHLGPIIEELTQSIGREVCYVTSQADDPVLTSGAPGIRPFYIGSGSTRTAFFKLVDARVVVMTLPDLETFHLKRSVHPVHYVYVFHSIVSSHMIYRKGAFDAYDTVLCVGPHHVAEIRATEAAYGLRAKELVEHGYGRLDAILRNAADRSTEESTAGSTPGPMDAQSGRKILLAPSWGECSFIEAPVGGELIQVLLGAGHSVVLRLHPMTVRRFPKLAAELERRFATPAFRVETEMRAQESLLDSDLMVSDWSGAAFEYAFGLERPVLFVDTPKKINNPEYERIGRVAVEESMREELGGVIDPADLSRVLERVDALTADREAFRSRLRDARERTVFNVGRSAAVGAAEVARLAHAARGAVAAGVGA